jgi:hypothetical protein
MNDDQGVDPDRVAVRGLIDRQRAEVRPDALVAMMSGSWSGDQEQMVAIEDRPATTSP